jgi:hypothetical protein
VEFKNMTSSESLELTGIFSKQTIAKVGTGTTTRRVAQIGYYFVEQLDKDTYEVRPLNNEYVPSGDPVKISSDDLLNTPISLMLRINIFKLEI